MDVYLEAGGFRYLKHVYRFAPLLVTTATLLIIVGHACCEFCLQALSALDFHRVKAYFFF